MSVEGDRWEQALRPNRSDGTAFDDGARADGCTASFGRFGGLVIETTDRLLTPRPWTVLQAEWAAELAVGLRASPVVELCSGSGHIGLEVARRTDRHVVLVDADAHACEVAARNAQRNGLSRLASIRCQDLADPLPVTPALILADPPYVPARQTTLYPDDPAHAIDGGGDGLDPTRSLLGAIAPLVATGTPALVQLRGPAQVATLRAWLSGQPRLGTAVKATRTARHDRAVALLGSAATPPASGQPVR